LHNRRRYSVGPDLELECYGYGAYVLFSPTFCIVSPRINMLTETSNRRPPPTIMKLYSVISNSASICWPARANTTKNADPVHVAIRKFLCFSDFFIPLVNETAIGSVPIGSTRTKRAMGARMRSYSTPSLFLSAQISRQIIAVIAEEKVILKKTK